MKTKIAFYGCAVLSLAASACGSRGEHVSTDPLPLATCVPGPWISSDKACTEVPFCSGLDRAVECEANDCRALGVHYLRTDQSFWYGTLIASTQEHRFTRWLANEPRPWSVEDDGTVLRLDDAFRMSTCTEASLLFGIGDFARPWPRPEASLKTALDEADVDGAWTGHAY